MYNCSLALFLSLSLSRSALSHCTSLMQARKTVAITAVDITGLSFLFAAAGRMNSLALMAYVTTPLVHFVFLVNSRSPIGHDGGRGTP